MDTEDACPLILVPATIIRGRIQGRSKPSHFYGGQSYSAGGFLSQVANKSHVRFVFITVFVFLYF